MAHDHNGKVRRSSTPAEFVKGEAEIAFRYKRHPREDEPRTGVVVGSITAAEAERRSLGKCVRILKADEARKKWREDKLAADLAYARSLSRRAA